MVSPMVNPNVAVAAMLRTQFGSFLNFAFRELHQGKSLQPNWHTDLMAEHCSEVAARRTSRLMINVPPRSLKSETGSIALPAFMFGQDPTMEILIIAGSEKLGQELMSKLGRFIGSRKYRALFPDVGGTFAATTIRSRRGGAITCATVGQQLSGRGADLIVVDDPLSPYHALDAGRRDSVNTWYDAEVRTRMNNRTGGAIVIIMQRVHPGDLCAHLRAREQFTLVSLPAIVSHDETVHFPSGRKHLRRAFEVLQPARETPAQLEARLDEIGSFQFAGQYLQGSFRWEERTSRVEYLHPKRPQQWRPGDGSGGSGGLHVLNVKNDIKARYFRGYDIYEGLQETNWMTTKEWEADAIIQQYRLVNQHGSTN
jgi:hypothetical protein